MAWRIEFERVAVRELDKPGSQSAARILGLLRDRVDLFEGVRSIRRALKSGRLGEFRRYGSAALSLYRAD